MHHWPTSDNAVLQRGWSRPSAASPAARAPSWGPPAALLLLVIVEILAVTMWFDTWRLDAVASAWARAIARSSEYLRLAITIALVTLVVGGRAFVEDLVDRVRRAHHPQRWVALAGHALALLVFVRLTAFLFPADPAALAGMSHWAPAWFLACGAAAFLWTLALLPAGEWHATLSARPAACTTGVVVGSALWMSGVLGGEVLAPLASSTYTAAAWVLGWFYDVSASRPARLVLGTPTFSVRITPACSGYEGIALITVFVAAYLWFVRRDLRFPAALALVPFAAAAAWTLNLLRIVALVAIGTAGWPHVALGGFHSQAGWLSFNALALGIVALVHRGQYFRLASTHPAPVVARDDDGTTAYLAPFAMVLAGALVTGAFSAGFDWGYPLRVIAAGAVLWTLRREYRGLGWSISPRALLIGAAIFLMWLWLLPTATPGASRWPPALLGAPLPLAAVWLIFRVLGHVITVPLAEELAFRGYVMRRLARADFLSVPLADVPWIPVVASSVLFGVFHGEMWVAGTLAGLAFAVAVRHRGALADGVQAHATANALIAAYVLWTGNWAAWS